MSPTAADGSRLPIIRLWDQILVPLQGEVTDDLAERLCDEVLQSIYGSNATGLIIDVTGLWVMDSHLCAVVTRLAEAAQLMGTRTILSGMSPETALTLQAMDIQLKNVTTAMTVEKAFELLGLRLAHVAPSSGELPVPEDALPFGAARPARPSVDGSVSPPGGGRTHNG